MRALLLATLVVVVVSADEGNCPAWRDWRAWTDECLWFKEGGLNYFRDKWVEACDIRMDTSKMPQLPQIPGMPDKCGHCTFKLRCRKRPRQDGCSPLDSEKEVCNAHGDVCNMPKFPLHNLGCRYEFGPIYLAQCGNRADLADWKRDGWRKKASMLPQFHCQDNENDECKCCCHPYEPTEDGSSCQQIPMPDCHEFSEWNDWSERCMWFPINTVHEDIVSHCGLEEYANKDKAKKFMEKFKMPDSIADALPDRCGYCSFKFKCRKRPATVIGGDAKECFPLEVQKKACGPNECETCGDVCQLPKILGSCNITETIRKLVAPSVKTAMKKMPHSMRDGMFQMIANMPHGKCVEKNDKCHCCCHPYEPTEDGTACRLNNICKTPEDLGVEVDMNLPSAFYWF